MASFGLPVPFNLFTRAISAAISVADSFRVGPLRRPRDLAGDRERCMVDSLVKVGDGVPWWALPRAYWCCRIVIVNFIHVRRVGDSLGRGRVGRQRERP